MGSPNSQDIAPPAPRILSRGLEKAAGRVVRAWRLALGAVLLLAVGSAAMTVLALTRPDRMPAYAVGWGLVTLALLAALTRFVPRSSPPVDDRIRLSAVDAERLADWLLRHVDGWQPRVRLSAAPIVRVDDGVLVIGLPMWLCLREHELLALVRDAREVDERRSPAVERAFTIARRGSWRRGLDGAGRSSRRRAVMVSRIVALVEAHNRWVDALRHRRGPEWPATAQAAETLAEAWDLMVNEWLGPAVRCGVWHADPYTGLRDFVTACEETGFFQHELARSPGPAAHELLRDVEEYERALAELLVESWPHDDEPTAWSDHPTMVSEPQWRGLFAAGLHAADVATGRPQAASLESLLLLLESGWGDTVAALLTAGRGAGPEDPDRSPPATVLHDLLEAAVSVALLDGGIAKPAWRWPYGTVLVTETGEVLAVGTAVSGALDDAANVGSCWRLRAWLSERGLELMAPLWLAEGIRAVPERAQFAFEAFRGLRTLHVVASDRYLRLFRRGSMPAVSEGLRMRVADAGSVLTQRMEAVEAGDLTDLDSQVALTSIVRATLTPMIGGHWWRLRIRTPDQRLTVRGDGDGRAVAAYLATALGDRLATPWLTARGWALRVRNALGVVCLALGCFGLVLAAVVVANPPAHVSRLDALILAGVAAAVVVIGFIPDVVVAGARVLARPRGGLHRSLH